MNVENAFSFIHFRSKGIFLVPYFITLCIRNYNERIIYNFSKYSGCCFHSEKFHSPTISANINTKHNRLAIKSLFLAFLSIPESWFWWQCFLTERNWYYLYFHAICSVISNSKKNAIEWNSIFLIFFSSPQSHKNPIR